MPVLVHCHEFAPMRESCRTRIPAKGSHEFANLTERAVGHDVSTDNHVRSRENQSVQNGHFLKRQIIIGAAMIEGSDPNWPRSSPSGMAGVFSVVLAKMIEEQKETVGAARVTRQISILICGVLKMMFQPSLHRG